MLPRWAAIGRRVASWREPGTLTHPAEGERGRSHPGTAGGSSAGPCTSPRVPGSVKDLWAAPPFHVLGVWRRRDPPGRAGMLRRNIIPLKGPRTQTPQLERQYAATSPERFLRELVVNGAEAGATEVVIEPWLNPKAPSWGIKLFVADNGSGMTPEQLVRFMGTYAHSGKELGIQDKNFGVGSRATCLPWNPFGVVVISWTRPDDDGTLVWLTREGDEYGLLYNSTPDGGVSEGLAVEGEWLELRRRFTWSSGTVVVLLGKDEKDDSWFGPNARLKSVDPIRRALNMRFLRTPGAVTIKAVDPSTTDMQLIRDHLSGASRRSAWQVRTVRGLLHELSQGRRTISARGEVVVDHATIVEWILWNPAGAGREAPYDQHYIVVARDDEIYASFKHHQTWRAFGLGEVRDLLTLIINPVEAHPDQTREQLILKDHEGEQLPILEWGAQFYEQLPPQIRAAILAARKSDEAQGKLPQHIAERIKAACRRFLSHERLGEEIHSSSSGVYGAGTGFRRAPSAGEGGGGGGSGSTAAHGVGGRVPGGKGTSGTRPHRVRDGIVAARWDAGPFAGDLEGLAAFYTSADGMLVLNPSHPLFEGEIAHYQGSHPSYDPNEIAKLVKLVYATAMAARVTHAETWLSKEYTDNQLQEHFLTPQALTVAAFGLYGLEQEIEHTIRHSGVRAVPAADPNA